MTAKTISTEIKKALKIAFPKTKFMVSVKGYGSVKYTDDIPQDLVKEVVQSFMPYGEVKQVLSTEKLDKIANIILDGLGNTVVDQGVEHEITYTTHPGNKYHDGYVFFETKVPHARSYMAVNAHFEAFQWYKKTDQLLGVIYTEPCKIQ